MSLTNALLADTEKVNAPKTDLTGNTLLARVDLSASAPSTQHLLSPPSLTSQKTQEIPTKSSDVDANVADTKAAITDAVNAAAASGPAHFAPATKWQKLGLVS